MAEQEMMVERTLLALQLRPGWSDEQLMRFLGLEQPLVVAFWKDKAQALLAQGQVVCEICGTIFQDIEGGYYWPGEYAYCHGCCNW